MFKQRQEIEMNWDQVEGNWKQLKGNVKEQWGKLTDDQLDVIAGKRDQLAGKIQEAYGSRRRKPSSSFPTGRNASVRSVGVAPVRSDSRPVNALRGSAGRVAST